MEHVLNISTLVTLSAMRGIQIKYGTWTLALRNLQSGCRGVVNTQIITEQYRKTLP